MKTLRPLAAGVAMLALAATPAQAQVVTKCTAFTTYLQSAASDVCSPTAPLAPIVSCALATNAAGATWTLRYYMSGPQGMQLQVQAASGCTAQAPVLGTFPGKLKVTTAFMLCGQPVSYAIGSINSVVPKAGVPGQTSNQVAATWATSATIGTMGPAPAGLYLHMLYNWGCL